MLAALALASVIATSLAVPTARQVPSGPCAHFAGGFPTASNFTLAALNRTLSNANTTGAPLVLGQAGAVDGASFEVLSTWASYRFNDWPSLSLVDGGLYGNPVSPNQVKAVSGGATNGSEVSFITTLLNTPTAAQVYCAVANTDPAGHSTGFPALALNGETDLFSLCLTGTEATAQNNVVYNASAAGTGGYILDSCYPVTLQLIGLPK